MPLRTPRPCFVVNPKSAGGRTGRRWDAYASQLSNAFEDFTIRTTRCKGDGKEQTRQALSEGYNVVVSIGGDGTNNEVVNGFFQEDGSLVSPEAEFMFFPSGSGGDLRRSLMPAQSLEGLIQGIKHGRQKRLDLGRAEFHDHDGRVQTQYFLNIGSVGLSGLICDYVNASSKPLGGTVAFYLASVEALFRYTSPCVEVQIDDHPPERMTIQTIAVANGKYYGGGMKIAPDASLEDGLFDITVLRETRAVTPVLHTKYFYKGTHGTLPYVSMHRGAQVTITSEEEVLLELDGETPGKCPLRFNVLPAALPYRCPA